MAAVLKIAMMRRHILRSVAPFHMAGAVRRCEVRRLMFKGFERVVSSEVVVPRIASVCLESGAPWYARSTVVRSLSAGILS
jgi:hypothetical protein